MNAYNYYVYKFEKQGMQYAAVPFVMMDDAADYFRDCKNHGTPLLLIINRVLHEKILDRQNQERRYLKFTECEKYAVVKSNYF